jgi:hypothetical protein
MMVGLDYIANVGIVDGWRYELISSCFCRDESEELIKSVGSVLTGTSKLKYKTFSCVCSFCRGS